MQKSNDAVLLAKKMKSDLEKDWSLHIEDANLDVIFKPVFSSNLSLLNKNAIFCFIIFAYSEESSWLNPRSDRKQNKIDILQGIGVDPAHEIYQEILRYDNDAIQQVIFKYLLSRTDSRFQEIISLIEYADKNLTFCYSKTTDKEARGIIKREGEEPIIEYNYLDQLETAKVNKEKGDLLFKALEAREKAEKLLKQLESDYQKTDQATINDFGFQFSDVRKFDIAIWEHRIRKRKEQIKH